MIEYETIEKAKTATYEIENIKTSNLFDERFIKISNGRSSKWFTAEE